MTAFGGAGLINELLRAGPADELCVDVMPVFLGAGLRLFGHAELGSSTSTRFLHPPKMG